MEKKLEKHTESNIQYEEILAIVQDELQLRDNNISAEAAYLRDAFLKAEQDYFVHLVTSDEIIVKLIKECNSYDVATLRMMFEQITQKMEFGLIEEKDEELYEKILVVLTAAIRDKQKRKVLDKIYDTSHGRTR